MAADSKAALWATSNPIVSSATVLRSRTALISLSTRCCVKLRWVRGHAGHVYNEMADSFARQGSLLEPRLVLNRPWSAVRSSLHKEAMKAWDRKWNSLESCRQTREFFSTPGASPSGVLLSLDRKSMSRYIQLFTGHNYLRYHQFKIGRVLSKVCRLCKNEEETSAHLVWHCESLARKRLDFWTDSGSCPPLVKVLSFVDRHLLDLLLPSPVE